MRSVVSMPPLISEIVEDLWVGGCVDGLTLPDGIDHIISLYDRESYVVRHEPRSILTVRMLDSLDQGFEQVDRIAQWVNSCRWDGPTLVHCQAGLNRSCLIVARALILDGRTAGDAIKLIRERRSPACLNNESFERWLRYGN